MSDQLLMTVIDIPLETLKELLLVVFLRDDITCRPLAVELGYSIDYSKGFDFSLSFDKGNKRLWYCRKGWACAEIIEGYFRNHRYYDELEEALRTEA